MSVVIDTIEHMFDSGGVSSAALLIDDDPRLRTAQELQARIRQMQATKLDSEASADASGPRSPCSTAA